MSPWKGVILSFALLILVGAILLTLPIGGKGLSPIDALFTAASASCVAGLSVVDISKLSWFAKWVILLLIQTGGLGVMTLSFFFMFMIRSPKMSSQVAAGKLLDLQTWAAARKFVFTIIVSTLVIEAIGFFGFIRSMLGAFPRHTALFNSLFHSVSSFCNCGLDMTGGSFEIITENAEAIATTTFLTILGGLGFYVLEWLWLAAKQIVRERKIPRAPLHVKIVLISTLFLLLIPAVLVFVGHSFPSWSTTTQRAAMSLCYSSSLRSAGFAVLRLAGAAPWLLVLSLVTMFIGANPGSCGGGVKATTFSIFVLSARATILGRGDKVEVFGRQIPKEVVYRATAVILTSLFFLGFFTFLLLATDGSLGLLNVIFESTSAFATCGLSTGITKEVSALGKVILALTMFVGRVGPLTVAMAVGRPKEEKRSGYRLPEAKVELS